VHRDADVALSFSECLAFLDGVALCDKRFARSADVLQQGNVNLFRGGKAFYWFIA
jgi:hypothetical protein